MVKDKQTYKYKKEESIVDQSLDEYFLSEHHYYLLHSFFVTYSLCGTQSRKKRTLCEYGWTPDSFTKSGLKSELEKILKLDDNKNFCFTEEDDLADRFKENDLLNGPLANVDIERAVISKTQGDNKYLKLFYRIRDGFAHGSFSLRLNTSDEKMIVIQDQDKSNVSARIVMKLNTLLQFIYSIDRNHLVNSKQSIDSTQKEVA